MSTRTSFLIIGCICLAAAFSLFIFNGQSLRLDEAQSLWQTSHSVPTMLSLIASDVHVPLYLLLLRGWEVFFGNEIEVARLLSLLFFLLSIPALALLGSYIYDERVGFYAALLLTLSPFMNWYGNELRMYSLFTLLTILNQYFFLRIVHNHMARKKATIWAGYIATGILGMYTHYFFNFLFVGQALFVLLHRDLFSRETVINFLKSAGIAALAFTPWIILVLTANNGGSPAPHLPPPNSINLFNTFSQFLFGFQEDHINTLIVSLWPLSILLVFLTLQKNKEVSTETIYLVISILVPIALAFIVSISFRPLFLSRYLILSLPGVYLILSWIFSVYPPPLNKVAKVVLACAMIVMLGFESFSASTPVKEDYRAASQYLMQNAKSSDAIVITAPFTVYPIEYYYRGPASIETAPEWDRFTVGPIPDYNEEELQKQIDRLRDRYQRMWVLFSYDQGYEDEMKLYLDQNLERKGHWIFSPNLELREYQLQYQ